MKKVTVGLLWHSGASGNLGVVALTLSQMAIVKSAAGRAGVEVEFIIFGWKIDGSIKPPAEFDGIEYVGLGAKEIFNPFSVFRKELKRCRFVLDVGEGDSFSDIYGLKRLAFLSVSKLVAGGGGRTLVLSPQTLGPFSSFAGHKLGQLGLLRAAKIFARDPLSKKWLDDNGYEVYSAESIDMAFRLPFELKPRDPSRLRIGLNISGLLYSGGYGGKNSLKLKLDFAELTHKLIDWATNVQKSEVWLISHVTSRSIPEEDDSAVADKLIKQFPLLKKAPAFNSPVEAKTFMSQLDFFVGARMHACIGAFSAGVPTVPLAYSRKFNGLFSSLGYPVLVDCLVHTTDEGYKLVLDAFESRGAITHCVEEGKRLAEKKLSGYEKYLDSLFLVKSDA